MLTVLSRALAVKMRIKIRLQLKGTWSWERGFGVTFQVGETGNLEGQETPALKHAGAAQ